MGVIGGEITKLEEQLKKALDEIEILKTENTRLRQENDALRDTIALLKKNSGNSSKPPSSDIVKPPKEHRNKGKQKIGAQKGHKRHLREPFPEDQVDKIVELTLESCPNCGGGLQPTDKPPKTHQQVELVAKPFIVTEYHQATYWCGHCQQFHTAPLPPGVKKSGLFGPRLIALTGYLKGRGHMSFKTLQDFLADALSICVSTGFLAKQIRRTSEALKGAHEELLAQLPLQGHLHIDETGGKENGDTRWNWCFLANGFTVFYIASSRSSAVLEKLLGKDYAGIISCDFYGAYRKFVRMSSAMLQFCWAHLIREVKYIAGSEDKAVSDYGGRLLEEIRTMFSTIHRRGEILDRNWNRRMQGHQESVMNTAGSGVPQDSKALALSKRLQKHSADYFRFIENGLPATNNLCEQSIRRVVIDRKVTQGTRSDWGNRWLERFWSVLSTCEQRGKNVMVFMQSCIDALIHNLSPPKLL
jgi:transposase